MPSFKAVVQEVILDPDGYVDLFVQPPFTCNPSTLQVGAATIQGDPNVTAPEGALDLATAVAVFPVSYLEDFVAGDEVHVSWRSRPDGTMGTLRIALA